ncbi:Mss4-like protein [Lentinula novae-zelandiae]|nr:Mss4-like protein [Lentinula novae-zelandiae]
MPFHGTCLCGGITFQVDNDPIVFGWHNALPLPPSLRTHLGQHVAIVPTSLTITKGENLLSTYRDATQDSGNALKRMFCSQCGSPLYNDGGDAGKTLAVFYSALIDFGTEDQKDPKPELEYYTKDRVAWVHAVEGTAFSTNVIFPGGSLTFIKGENLLSTYKDAAQDSGNAIKRVFCSRCGSPLYNEGGDDAKTVSVFYSALIDFATQDEKNRTPELEFYTKDRLEWVHAVQGAEQSETIPGRDTLRNIGLS